MSWRRAIILTWFFASLLWMSFIALSGWFAVGEAVPSPRTQSSVMYFPSEDKVYDGAQPLAGCPSSYPVEYEQWPAPDASQGSTGPWFKQIAATMLITCEPAGTTQENQWIMQIKSDEEAQIAFSHIESLVLNQSIFNNPQRLFLVGIYSVYAVVPPTIIFFIGWIVSRFMLVLRPRHRNS